MLGRFTRTLTPAVTLLALSFAPTADAQLDPVEMSPVDQSVEDLDRRAAGMRRVEQGIGVFGQAGSLYRNPGASPWSAGQEHDPGQQFLYRQPGVTAWIDQPGYVTQDSFGDIRFNTAPGQDGAYLQLVSPNTVFDLTPNTAIATQDVLPAIRDGWQDTRINTRIDGTIQRRIDDPSGLRFPAPPKAHKVPTPRPEQVGGQDAPPDDRDMSESGESQDPVDSDSSDTSVEQAETQEADSP